MNDRILFSIIIPAYNRAGFIPATLNSVLEQTYFNFEILVVNDGSTDNTEQVVKPYLNDTRIKYYAIQNAERGAARNFGVAQSHGDYITFLDSDDIFLPWHLATAAAKLSEGNLPVFHLSYEILHPNGRVDAVPVLPSPANRKLLEGNFLSCMGVFLRRDVALANKFDEDRQLSGSEDYELWMRIAARMPIVTFPDVTSRLINHDSRSVIQTDPRKLIDRITLLDKKLNADEAFLSAYGRDIDKFGSYRTLYLSLHLAMSGQRWMAFRSIIFTAWQYPYVIFTYRFMVAVKKIVLW
jgi:glycosyltransferase involved in cell wall biosynthesis